MSFEKELNLSIFLTMSPNEIHREIMKIQREIAQLTVLVLQQFQNVPEKTHTQNSVIPVLNATTDQQPSIPVVTQYIPFPDKFIPKMYQSNCVTKATYETKWKNSRVILDWPEVDLFWWGEDVPSWVMLYQGSWQGFDRPPEEKRLELCRAEYLKLEYLGLEYSETDFFSNGKFEQNN